ncbi:Dihydrofolate reductase type 3 [Paenibacillus plantiphilus]|uniref:Dihydrofolate reductase n=1 Tax=Paenibacillus plantiphilus TaxID=2905650 RepID=A0ABM9C3N9_9BACL|nr:dihydrofolate reductase [Paenibacillus plantiphilus]CAH1203335.1 Dihydrofolate reductase type 3 [Paenibacillus plantiphilus]
MASTITIIAAMAHNNVIGINNELPWKLPAEMAHFRRSTIGKTVVMGRKTYESLGRPLKDRRNIVLTRNQDWSAEGCETVHTVQETLSRLAGEGEELVIIGGEEIYKQFLAHADKLLLTEVSADIEGDAFFPAFTAEDWQLEDQVFYEKDEKNGYNFKICTYLRKTLKN